MNYINETVPIKELVTNKNVDKYIIDGMNQLSPNVVGDSNEEILVYKDKNGNAIYDKNSEIAKEYAKNSYYSSINENFYVDGRVFKTLNEVANYYQTNFLNNKDNVIKQDLYSFNSVSYNKNELKSKIESSVKAAYKYDETIFLDSEINQPNLITPNYIDKQAIKKYFKSPGKYLVEARSSAGGTYTGDLIIDSETNLEDVIHNENNWIKTGEYSEDIYKVVQNSAVSAIMMGVAPLVERLLNIKENDDNNGIKACFNNGDDFTLKSMITCFSSESDYSSLLSIIQKEELMAETTHIIRNLNNVESLPINEKATIFIYQMREMFRNVEISYVDNLEWNRIVKVMFSNFIVGINSWNALIEEIGEADILLLADYFVDKNSFDSIINQYVNKAQIQAKVKDFATELSIAMDSEKLAFKKKIFDTSMELISQAADIAINYIMETALDLAEAIPVIGDILEFARDFNIRTTMIYELILPNSDKKLTYQMSQWFFENKKFKPKEIFNVFEIKEPRKNETYILNGRYYSTYEAANEQLVKDIVTRTVLQGPYYYFIRGQVAIKKENKEELVDYWMDKIISEGQVEPRYLDYFGGVFDSRDEALVSMREKIKDEDNFKKTYSYRYGQLNDNEIFFDSLDEAKAFVDEDNPLTVKKVSVTEFISNSKFDELYDLSQFEQKICSFELYGMEYFYKNKDDAFFAILKILNFRNELVTTETLSYSLNGLEFENIIKYVEYLEENIVLVETKTQNNKYEGVNL
ncbi:hypothetical protein SCLARK_00415 [Spiroplasma clarkii]|uniref:Uncharacterized protein n=1 Tax=Spiroplasma clarkii TaxID=2139 RepID=A0A1Y0KZG9_9MOLU|nr:hypothetical protein [Spiroplasma clarkii]ARU91137.1 hypothetical protein SCLARK_00415 [Spiroplasma clarkii]ATX70581.1 hypothetical protein SCLAR_v1c02510 [Spiroplasma clarkii]